MSTLLKIKRHIASGKKLTKAYITRHDALLLNKCEAHAEKTGEPWQWFIYALIYSRAGCRQCGKPTTYYSKGGRHYFSTFCSTACSNSDTKKRIKTAQTLLKRYGSTTPMGNNKVRKKFEKTMLRRYGCRYSGESTALLKKAQRTLKRRYGVINSLLCPEVRAKVSATMKARYGVTSAFAHGHLREKGKDTMEARYGVRHSLQSRDLLEKQQRSGFKHRTFTLDGKRFTLRGYEPYAVRHLCKLGVSVDDIFTEGPKMPSFRYTTADGIEHTYHPDIYAKIEGKWYVIEVKSNYTSGLSGEKNGLYSILRRKGNAVKCAGYRFKVFIVTPHKKRRVFCLDRLSKRSNAIKAYQQYLQQEPPHQVVVRKPERTYCV